MLLKSLDLVSLGESILPQRFIQLVRSRLRASVEKLSTDKTMVSRTQALSSPGRTEFLQLNDQLRLSERERVILWHLTQGASNKLIARELQIAEATAKVHIKSILRKVNARNRTQAAIWAINNMGQAAKQEQAASRSLAPSLP